MASAYIDKIDTRTDAVVGYANVGATIGSGGDNTNGGWSIISVAPNDSSLMVSGYYCNNLVNVTTSSMLVNQSLSIDARSGYPPAPWVFPHGVAHNATFDTFYVALQWGNAVAKVSVNATTHRLTYKFIGVNGLAPASTSSADSFSPNPHFVQMAPDYKKYFVTCQGTNKVVVMNTANDSILKTIDVGAYPQEMTTYKEANELYVSCLEDANSTFTGAMGSIYVIDMNTLEVKTVIYGDFYQPHDMAVDGIDGYLYVISTNYSPTGPPPHHVTGCGPKAGWYTVVDLATHQQLDTRRYEMTYYPYAAAVRFAK
jgi:DNA-binding beta-propeller fold protein YncE